MILNEANLCDPDVDFYYKHMSDDFNLPALLEVYMCIYTPIHVS